jgi:transcriptional regulator with XRE-family HTH domain
MSESDTSPAPQLGGTLQAARKQRRLTLDQLAGRSGISKSMLSQIERSKVNPTFVVLWNLTQSLGIELSELLGPSQPPEPNGGTVVHVKAYSTPTIRSADGKCQLRILGPTRTSMPMEWYEISFEPESELDSQAHAKDTYEHLTVLSGRLRVHLPGQVIELAEGETLRYPSDQSHRIENETKHPAQALLVMALAKQ